MKKIVKESLLEFGPVSPLKNDLGAVILGIDEEPELEISEEPEIQPLPSNERRGAHYKAKLEELVDKAKHVYSNLPEEDVPAWVGDKITLAKDYLCAVAGWLHGEEEELEGIQKGPNREMDEDE